MRPFLFLSIVSAGLVILLASVLTASAAVRNVVAIYDERTALPGLAAIDASIIATLSKESPEPVQVYSEGMDLSRFGSETHMANFREYLRAKYADRKVDVAIAVLGPPLEFLLRYGQAIFPGAAIVFCAVEESEIRSRSLPSNVTGVVLKREFAPTLQMALRLQPDTRRVVVVSGTSKFDEQLLGLAKKDFRPYEDRLEFLYLTKLPLAEVLSRVARLPPHTIVLYTTLFRDGAGVGYVAHDVVEKLSAAASAPVYGFVDQFLGRGIVGGSLYSAAPLGQEAAKLAAQILGGTPASALPILPSPTSTLMFDWRQLQRWGIRESSLPPGSIVRFRELSVWQTYKEYIAGAVAFCMLEAILIIMLVVSRARLRRANVDRQRAEEDAHDLAARLIETQEQERMHVARELHDDLSQRLAAVSIKTGLVERKLAALTTLPPGTREAIGSIGSELTLLSEDTHKLSRRLHPAIIEHLGLPEALSAECLQFSNTYAVRVEADIADDVPNKLPLDIAICLFRVTQEALRNIARHAKAAHGKVDLRCSNGGLELVIEDDGEGFDPASSGSKAGIGISSMRERVSLLGGHIDIVSTPGQGVRITAWVPLKSKDRLQMSTLGGTDSVYRTDPVADTSS